METDCPLADVRGEVAPRVSVVGDGLSSGVFQGFTLGLTVIHSSNCMRLRKHTPQDLITHFTVPTLPY